MRKDMWRVEDMRSKEEIGEYDDWDDAVLMMDTHFPARIVRVNDKAIVRFHDQNRGIFPVSRFALN
jgi:hypothetical protein